MRIRTSAAVALVLTFALVACGSEDDGGGGGSTSGAAAVASCNTYCDAIASCPEPDYLDAADCKEYECSMLEQAPDACAQTFKAYYDCVLAKSDVCDETGCEPDIQACL